MTDAESFGTGDEAVEDEALLDRLRVIEDQPLDQRAASFASLHNALQVRLEGG